MEFLNDREHEAVDAVVKLGETWGFGNLISRLRDAWSAKLVASGMPQKTADMGAGHICVWCKTDWRTGKKAP